MGRLLYCFVFLGIYGLVTGNSDSTSLMGRHHKPSTKTDIYIAGFFALSDHDIEAALGRGVMPAIKLALKHINDNPNILPDHKLHLYFNDTKCSASVGMKAFFDMMDRRPNKLMILGGSCTPVTDPIAKTSKHWRVTVLSYADTHPMFTRKTYPNFYRIVPSENAFSIPRLKLLQAFNWTRVGTLYQNQPRFSLAHNSLVSVLDMADIQIAESQSFVDDLVQPLGKLKEKDVRIILANFNATWGRRVFCEVFRSEMYGRRYQWIVAGPRQEFWWLENDPSVNCTVEQIEVALQGTFLVDVLPLTSSTELTVSGLTAQEYEAQYAMLRGSEYSQFHGYAYDAIWTIAQTIDSVTRKLKHHKRGHNSYGHSHSKHNDITDFVYRDHWWEKIFIDTLRNTSFNGVTGPVSFADNERKGHLLVKQVQGRREVQVAEYDSYLDSILINEEAISWVGGKFPPKDRTIEIIEPSRISISVFVVLTTAAVLGIALASSFLAINVRFRNQRNIKMSSPYLNNLIIIGCLLTYTSVILLGLDSRLTGEAALPIICTARIWTLMAGFTLAFGSMFSKTWRVHSIFTDVKLNKKAIKDYQLFMVVGVLLTIDIAILTTWQVIDPFYRETKYLDPFLDPTNEDVLVRPENEYCKSQYMTSFVGAIYAYKGLLMAFGCFLAWETRNVNIPALNDSKYIGMSVYNVVIMCVIGAAISYILSDQQDVSFIIISIFVIFCTTGTLCLVFVPKIIELRHNPQGNVEKRVRTVLKAPAQKYNPAPKGSRDDIQKARMRNAKVRKDIKAVDDEIQKLLKQLGDDEVLLLKDGPSVSVQGCSDGRLPSVSGIDTISLSSIISSPDPTLTSPNHIKQNEESSQPNQIDPCTAAADEGAEPAGVAMWSAISNPLLLISHVLKKSMDLGETSSVNSDSIPPTFQCELVIEKHDSPLRATPFVTKGSISLENICESQTRVSVQQRSFSLNPVDVIENCLDTSDSSFNRESNTSEDYESENPNFEYKSLESLQSPSSGCTSTFVNYDETETPVVDNFFDPESFSQENQTSSENVCHTDNSDYFHERVLVSASLPRQTRTRKKRQRTITARDSKLRFASVSAPDIRKTNAAADESSDFEILPIFQQLVAQKHQEVNRDLEPKTLSCPNLSIKCDVVEYI